MISNKESIRFFLHRHLLRKSTEKDQLRCLQDCMLNPPEQHGSSDRRRAWALVMSFALLISILFLVMNQSPWSALTNTIQKYARSDVVLRKKVAELGPRYLGRQLVAPVTARVNEDIERSVEYYWYFKDLLLRTLLLKIKMLKKEHKSIFTPRPAFEFTEIPTTTSKITAKNNLPICRIKYDNHTEFLLNLSKYNGSLEDLYPRVGQGGYYRPEDCWTRHKVAILVPYRNRQENLRTFLINIHPFLMAQNLEYRIFIVEQFGGSKFNKGRLLNAGFKVLQKLGDWPCLILHDVDLLPTNPHILYSCSTHPRLMSTALHFANGSYDKVSNAAGRFGGVAAITAKQYKAVNGHSNLYRGWGNEDTDMYIRLRMSGLRVTKNSKNISRFIQLSHRKGFNKDINLSLLFNAKFRYKNEGLSTLEYNVLNVTYHHLYTRIIVVLNEEPKV